MICKKPITPNLLFETVQIFTTSLCNLRCKYCYICKDDQNILKVIDKDIEKEWENDVYISRMREEWSKEDIQNIHHISLWGGEPLLGISRFTNKFDKYYDFLPKFDMIDLSTNFTTTNAVEAVEQLIGVIHNRVKNDNRFNKNNPFHVDLQISVDGPPEFNDLTRGVGTTDKIVNNYLKLLTIKVPDTILVRISTKPTLSAHTFNLFDTDDNAFNYFNWFNVTLWEPFNISKPSNMDLWLGIPNYVEPYDYTKQDGIVAAENFRSMQRVSNSRTIEGFQDRSLVPYASRSGLDRKSLESNANCYRCGGLCGQVVYTPTFTPNGGYAVCHRGVFDAYLDYAKVVTDNDNRYLSKLFNISDYCGYNWDLHQFNKVRRMINTINQHPSRQVAIDLNVAMQVYARAGIIDEKYLTDQCARNEYINYIFARAVCMFSHIELCGSIFTQSHEFMPFFLNGVMDVISEEIKSRG